MADTYSKTTGIYPSIPTPTGDPDTRDPNDINKHLRVRK